MKKICSNKPKFAYGGDFLMGGTQGLMQGAGMGAQFGPWGAAIGGVAGFATQGLANWLNAKEQDKEDKKNQEFIRQQMDMMKSSYDKSLLSSYPTQGITNYGFGKYGLNLKKYGNGGNLMDSSEPKVIQGPDHEEGGVEVTTSLGTPVAEVEGEEVVVDNKVFSKRLQTQDGLTFADKALLVAETPEYKTYLTEFEKAKERAENTDMITAQSGKLELEALVNPMDVLFAEQEAVKQQVEAQEAALAQQQQQQQQINPDPTVNPLGEEGLPMGKYGIELDDSANGLGMLGTFGDNIVNAIGNLKTPSIPRPILNPLLDLKTRYNNEAEIADITSQVKAANTGVDNSFTTGGSADNRKRANLALGIKAKMSSYQNKENTETNLINSDIELKAKQIALNNAKLEAFNNSNAERKLGMLENMSENAADLGDNLTQFSADRKKEEMDLVALEAIMEKYKATGVGGRNKLHTLLNHLKKKRYNGTPYNLILED